MKPKPLILITPCSQVRGAEFADPSLSLSHRYWQAVQAAGGLSWVAPAGLTPVEVDECVRRSDGVMLTGGNDVQPDLYRVDIPERLKKTIGAADTFRDLMELHLIQAVFHYRKPLMAICRGQQMLNVALGGDLVVDIPSEIPKALSHCELRRGNELIHELTLAPGSRLARLLGRTTIKVNSTHHQAVKRVAKSLKETAASADGVIEALEWEDLSADALPYLLSVQFHPERLYDQHREFLALFDDFLQTCRQRRKKPV